MKHELLIPFEINSDAIEQRLEAEGYERVLAKVHEEVERSLRQRFGRNKSWYDITAYCASEYLSKLFDKHRDEIIEAAVKEVAKKIQNSKAYKDAVVKVASELVGNGRDDG